MEMCSNLIIVNNYEQLKTNTNENVELTKYILVLNYHAVA